MIERKLQLPPPGTETFFLWGARQTGKSTLLRTAYPDALWVDLLKSEEFRRYLERPELLRQEIAGMSPKPFVVIDEVQKVPQLLEEVHWLHEREGMHFALCGSSARKVKRGQANLLGGRAIRYQLFGLTSAELGADFDLERLLNHGYLPRIYLSDRPERLLRSYAADYLKEEIAAEGLVRNLPVFSHFLDMAAMSDTEMVNFSTIARDCGVSSPTVKGYFGILTDTLLGSWLPAYRKRPKRRVNLSPKFFFSDVGVVNLLGRRGRLVPRSELYGKAFENWVHHELQAFNQYAERFAALSYWRLVGGTEVDFIVNDMEVAIEAKAVARVTSDHVKGLRELAIDQPSVAKRLVVCLEEKPRTLPDGTEVLPAAEFARRLWDGQIF
jgi:predicted AAA+ superfamily ATPase